MPIKKAGQECPRPALLCHWILASTQFYCYMLYRSVTILSLHPMFSLTRSATTPLSVEKPNFFPST